MCLGLPMRVIVPPSGFSLETLCEGRGEQRHVSLALVGPQPKGTWVLVFSDHARRVLEDEEARQIDLALEALDAALSGETNFDRFFPEMPSASSTSEGK